MSMSRKWVTLVIVVALLGVGATIYFVYYSKDSDTAYEARTTSKAETAQKDYDKGSPRTSNTSGSNNNGGVVDGNGQIDVNSLPSADKWTKSDSGAITLKQPVRDAVVKNGDVLSGSAAVDVVQYRIVDDESGVIGQGSLNVVNGTFSGKLQFTSLGRTGAISIFNYDKTSGAEINSIKITVKFE